MRNRFKGYFKPTDADFADLWKNCLFVLDTSVLLNTYGYSEGTRTGFLNLLERLKDRIWMPSHVGTEFFRRRLSVISTNCSTYQIVKQRLTEIIGLIDLPDGHPFISGDATQRFKDVVGPFLEEVEKAAAPVLGLLDRDLILERLADLFEGKFGDEYSNERLAEIFKDGELRYKGRKPPGFQDENKDKRTPKPEGEPDEKNENKEKGKSKDAQFILDKTSNKYGDLIIWMQILEKAEKSQSNIVLITDETKRDWWEIHKEIVIGPRPELIQEFHAKTSGRLFYLYKAFDFVKSAETYLGEHVQQSVIDEVRVFQEREAAISDYESDLKETAEVVSAMAELQEQAAFSANDGSNQLARLRGMETVRMAFHADKLARAMSETSEIPRALRALDASKLAWALSQTSEIDRALRAVSASKLAWALSQTSEFDRARRAFDAKKLDLALSQTPEIPRVFRAVEASKLATVFSPITYSTSEVGPGTQVRPQVPDARQTSEPVRQPPGDAQPERHLPETEGLIEGEPRL